jgi:hypothetical protein
MVIGQNRSEMKRKNHKIKDVLKVYVSITDIFITPFLGCHGGSELKVEPTGW